MSNLKKEVKENLVASFHLSNNPIKNVGNNVLLDCEFYRSEDVTDCINTVMAMDSDMYLDLLIEKNKYKGQGDVYFSSNVVGDFYKLCKNLKEKEAELIIEHGVLAVYNEEKEDYKILKEIE